MYSYIIGYVTKIAPKYITLESNNIGYELVVANPYNFKVDDLPLKVYIYQHVREDAITLYGFISQSEHEYFNLLTLVQGVGPKAGLSILSALSPEQISSAILSGDVAAFTLANGIGKKTAERIITELKDKVGKANVNVELFNISKEMKNDSIAEDAISALSNLGYTRSQSFSVVMKIVNNNPMISMNDLIKLALKEINNF